MLGETITPILWIYTSSLVLSVIVCFVVTSIAYRNEFPGNTALAGVFLTGSLWSLGTLGTLITGPRVGAQIFWNQIQMTGVIFVPVTFAVFVYRYSGIDDTIPYSLEYVLLGVPTISLLLLWTAPAHNFLWAGFTYTQTTPVTVVSWAFSGWFYVHLIYNAILLFGGASLLLRVLLTSDMYTDQSLAVASAVVAPFSVYLIDFTIGLPTLYHPTQALFWVSGCLVTYAITRTDLVGNSPVAAVLARHRLLDRMGDGAVITNANGVIIEANKPVTSLLDCSSDDLLGEPAVDALPVDSIPEEAHETQLSHTQQPAIIRVTTSPLITRTGTRVGDLVVFRNITQQRRRTQQLDVTNRILRHNVRNKLNIALGHINVIKDNLPAETPNRIHDSVRSTHNSCERLSTLAEKAETVDKLFDDMTVGEFDPKPVIESVSDSLTGEFPDATISMTMNHTAPAVGPNGIEHALSEIVENACKHTGSEPVINITTRTTGTHTEIRVQDDGPGIPESERQVISAEQSETPLNHSSGVGLWIAYWVVTAAGGDLSFKSTEDGTTVTVALQRSFC